MGGPNDRGDVPLEGWKALAQGFLDRYQR